MKILVILSYLITVAYCDTCYREILVLDGRIRGHNEDDPHVFSFYGIPYASVPKGVDKFKAPLPAKPWSGVLNATDRNIACPQPGGAKDGLKITMDCLVLNVFMPALEKSNRSVYVYLHGGKFKTGSSGVSRPIDLARRGIIVVTVNYRLGAYGFLCLNTEFAPGNAGIKDQLAALRWVRNNIKYFDGDSARVTLGGSDAGAASTEILMLNPTASGYFTKAICESGSAITSLTTTPLEVAKNHAFYFSSKASISPLILEQIYRSLDDRDLETDYKGNIKDMTEGFAPCVETHNIPGEQKMIFEMPLRTLVRGNFERKPYMTGFTTFEGSDWIPRFEQHKTLFAKNFSMFIPSSVTFSSSKDREKKTKKLKSLYIPKKDASSITMEGYLNYASDAFYRYPVILSSRLHKRKTGNQVFLYFFAFNGGIKIAHRYMIGQDFQGPGHMAQSLYIQDPRPPTRFSGDDYTVQDKLREMWTNFIKFGDPVPHTTSFLPVKWNPVQDLSCNCLVITRDCVMVQQPLKEMVVPWDGMYNIQMPDYSGMPVKSYLAALVAAAGAASIFYATKK